VPCISRHTMDRAPRPAQYSPITLLGSPGDTRTLCLYRQAIDNAENGFRLTWRVCANRFHLEWQAGLPEADHRWVVERTLAWLNQCRRLSKDYEELPTTSETFVYVAMTRLMLKRLAA